MTATRIYVACLASYNSGILHGAWIDCADKDAEDIQTAVSAMLAASPIKDAEEWAIHDNEGFGRLVGEYTSFEDVATIAEALSGDHARGFRWLIADVGLSIEDAADQAENVMIHESNALDLANDYAEDWIEETYGEALKSLPDLIRNNIDAAGIAHDLKCNGDIVEAEDADGRFLVTNANDF